ncbi:MAG: cyclic nucleotide-binding domain-containing protein [Bdellovibrionota bacterium]
MDSGIITKYATGMAKSTLFYGISIKDLEDLAAQGKVLNVEANSNAITEGELVSGLHVLVEGTVKIVKKGKTIVANLEEGSFFGEITLFGQTITGTATVSTDSGCVILVFTRRQLEQWFQKQPYVEVAFFRNIATELCNRLVSTTEQLTAALTASLN